MEEPEEIPIKVVLCGATGCGKTSLALRWTQQYFTTNYTATIGMGIYVHTIRSATGSHTYRLQIWDTSGQERFHTAMAGWMKDAHIFCFCYNINSRLSWNEVPIWLAKSKWAPLPLSKENGSICWGCHENPRALGFLVGTQADRVTYREVDAEDVSGPFAAERNLRAFETSALTAEGITEFAAAIVEALDANPSMLPIKNVSHRLSVGEPVDTPLLLMEISGKRKKNKCGCCW